MTTAFSDQRQATFHHVSHGPFVQGLPAKQGFYWLLRSPTCPVGAQPALVLLGDSAMRAVRCMVWGGWEPLPLDDPFVTGAWYAPMCPPDLPEVD